MPSMLAEPPGGDALLALQGHVPVAAARRLAVAASRAPPAAPGRHVRLAAQEGEDGPRHQGLEASRIHVMPSGFGLVETDKP